MRKQGFSNAPFTPTEARINTQEVLFGPGGMLYVTFADGAESNVIHRYDPETGTDPGAFTSGYDLDLPTKMRIGPDGNFYVSQGERPGSTKTARSTAWIRSSTTPD